MNFYIYFEFSFISHIIKNISFCFISTFIYISIYIILFQILRKKMRRGTYQKYYKFSEEQILGKFRKLSRKI